jgi:hypothetical protein
MIGEILIAILGNTAYDNLKKIFKTHLTIEDEKIFQLLFNSIEAATEKFFTKYGDRYGTIESSFLSKEENWDVIIRCIFYGSEGLDVEQFELSGFGINKEEAKSGAQNFVGILHTEMRKHWQLDKILTEKSHINETSKFMKETKESLTFLENKLPNISPMRNFPTNLIDQNIKKEIDILRKSRFFNEFNIIHSSLVLGNKLVKGELSGGSDSVKARALAWCARFLIRSEELRKAEEYLNLAKGLGSCPEITVAEAFVNSQKGNQGEALSVLAGMSSPMSRSAAFMIVTHHEDVQGAIDWFKKAKLEPTDLDSDGKCSLILQLLQLTHWDEAKEIIHDITEQDLEETPVLHHIIGMIYLLSTVPIELRAAGIIQLPFEIINFPLASDVASINARREANHYFNNAAEIARQLDCNVTATIDEEYAIWLEIIDPDHSNEGIQRLEAKLRDPSSALRLVHLALHFGINLDLKEVEQEIERQIALHGGITQDTAIACIAVALAQETPEEVVQYIDRHYKELIKHLDKKSIQMLQMEMLSKAGLHERANECFGELVEEGISSTEENRIRAIITQAIGNDPTETLKRQFKQTDSLGDLSLLVDALESNEKWDNLCEYGEILFERTHSIRDFERLANALGNAHKNKKLIELIRANIELLDRSQHLRIMYCWSLFLEGQLLESRVELAKINEDQNNRNYRTLLVNLRIAIGDWHSLSAFVTKEIKEKDHRSAHELIGAAQLALHLKLMSTAKELLFAAVEKANDDASIFSNAYFMATNAGWDDNMEISKWLQRAAELSGDDGPIQQLKVKDLIDRVPEWNRQESETWKSLSSGKIPQFLAAHSLNKSLINIMLFPILFNLNENDPRRRGVIAAFSGKRQPVEIDHVRIIGVDATTLLTLGFLNLLDKVFDSFEEVHVPHSTLTWLFEEKSNVIFHQPSRIRNAHKLHRMLMTDALQKFEPNTLPNSTLSDQVGEELAQLITEAETLRIDDNIQRIVVRPFPIPRLGSLMEEEADLTEHANVMSSCLSIVNKLRQKGQITAEEEKRARNYLQLQEKPWPNQPEITDGAILYLDDLAITYFLHLGILDKLQAAGFKAIASPRAVSEANELISYEETSGQIDEIIENIRLAISSRIDSRKIIVGRRRNNNDLEETSITEHPTVGVIALASECEMVISDDRFLNQHEHVNNGSAHVPISSSLDIIDALASIGVITSNERLEFRTLLRRAGYLYVSISEDELFTHLVDTSVVNKKIIETMELKAIRESILRVRMINWLQLPEEAPWLHMIFQAFNRVLKRLWNVGDEISSVVAKSNWILDQIDIRGWTHRYEREIANNLVKTGNGAFILMFLSPPSYVNQDVKDEYWNWIEEQLLVPIKEQEPELYAWIVDWEKHQIFEIINREYLSESRIKNTPHVRSALVMAALNLMPPMIKESLLNNKEFSKEYGLIADAVVTFDNHGVSFQRSVLYDVIRNMYAGVPERVIMDTEGREWIIKIQENEGASPILNISKDDLSFNSPYFAYFSQDSNTRLKSLKEAAMDVNLPIATRDTWCNILVERTFDDDEIDEFRNDICDTPVSRSRLICEMISNGKNSISSLVPPSRRYFERLVGYYNGSVNVKDYAVGQAKEHFEQLSIWNPYEGFLQSLYLSVHSDLTDQINVEHLESQDIVRAFELLEVIGDRVSQLGAIEVGLRILPNIPDIKPIIIRLIKQIRDDDVESSESGFRLLSALFILVDGELSRIRLFPETPPFYRRLISLTQAALIHRQLVNFSGVNVEQLYEWVLNTRGEQYYFQSFSDMRLEPHWNPDLVSASQLKSEFCGRIIVAANRYNIDDGELFELILGTKSDSLGSMDNLHQMFFPGPLEGTGNTLNLLPDELSQTIEAQLGAEEAGPSSFVALVNSALIFRVDTHKVEMAAKVISGGSHRLSNVKDRSQLLAILNGLASIAAVARNSSLSNELQILVRKYRHDMEYNFSIEEEIRICLVAAACHTDLNNWSDFVGGWLTELAFGKLEVNDREVFLSHLHCLCQVVPELWVTCGRAEAALKALC